MLASMTSMQIAEWYEYFKLEPWGERVEWYRIATLCALIANIHRRKGAPAIKAEDFMPPEIKAPTRARKQTPDEMKAMLMGMTKPKDGKTTKRTHRNG